MSEQTSTPHDPVVLCFSMHDATGATGVAADIEAISSQACHAATVVTCLSVQDSQSVSSLIPIDDDIIVQSARAVLEDMPVAAIKVGLTGSEETVQAIYDVLVDYPEIPIVLDPMLIGSNGAELVAGEVIESIRELLLPLASIISLNAKEAALLMPEADNQNAMINGLMDLGCEHVLLSGSLQAGDGITNALYHNYRMIEQFDWPRLSGEFYGAGCTLSASLSALLAQGLDWISASREAQNYCWQCLQHAKRYGMGQSQPSRFYWMLEE